MPFHLRSHAHTHIHPNVYRLAIQHLLGPLAKYGLTYQSNCRRSSTHSHRGVTHQPTRFTLSRTPINAITNRQSTTPITNPPHSHLPTTCHTSDDIRQWVEHMYGTQLWSAIHSTTPEPQAPLPHSLLHVTSLFHSQQHHPDELYTLQVGPGMPSLKEDKFILNLSRSLAHTVVYSGKVLREEPNLRCVYTEEHGFAEGLYHLRKELSLKPLPDLAILTWGLSETVDFTHPIFDVPDQEVTIYYAEPEYGQHWKRLLGPAYQEVSDSEFKAPLGDLISSVIDQPPSDVAAVVHQPLTHSSPAPKHPSKLITFHCVNGLTVPEVCELIQQTADENSLLNFMPQYPFMTHVSVEAGPTSTAGFYQPIAAEAAISDASNSPLSPPVHDLFLSVYRGHIPPEHYHRFLVFPSNSFDQPLMQRPPPTLTQSYIDQHYSCVSRHRSRTDPDWTFYWYQLKETPTRKLTGEEDLTSVNDNQPIDHEDDECEPDPVGNPGSIRLNPVDPSLTLNFACQHHSLSEYPAILYTNNASAAVDAPVAKYRTLVLKHFDSERFILFDARPENHDSLQLIEDAFAALLKVNQSQDEQLDDGKEVEQENEVEVEMEEEVEENEEEEEDESESESSGRTPDDYKLYEYGPDGSRRPIQTLEWLVPHDSSKYQTQAEVFAQLRKEKSKTDDRCSVMTIVNSEWDHQKLKNQLISSPLSIDTVVWKNLSDYLKSDSPVHSPSFVPKVTDQKYHLVWLFKWVVIKDEFIFLDARETNLRAIERLRELMDKGDWGEENDSSYIGSWLTQPNQPVTEEEGRQIILRKGLTSDAKIEFCTSSHDHPHIRSEGVRALGRLICSLFSCLSCVIGIGQFKTRALFESLAVVREGLTEQPFIVLTEEGHQVFTFEHERSDAHQK